MAVGSQRQRHAEHANRAGGRILDYESSPALHQQVHHLDFRSMLEGGYHPNLEAKRHHAGVAFCLKFFPTDKKSVGKEGRTATVEARLGFSLLQILRT